MLHQVFIERCRDSEPATATSLAQAVAARYQIDPEQILGRLRAGRFRVKANLELAAARAFKEYLESQGALCSIVDDAGTTVARSAGLTSSPSAPEEEDWGLTLQTPPPPDDDGMNYESGLSAGFGGGADSQGLGVLADAAAASSGSLTLSTLDGATDAHQDGSKRSVADASNVEAFLPPEMLAEAKLELGEEYDERQQAVEPAPPPEIEEPEPLAPAPAPMPLPQRCLNQLATSARVRLAVGVFLAFVVGFTVSSTVASGMEKREYSKATTQLETAYAAVDSMDAWGELDGIRSTTLKSLERRRKNIVVTSLLVWLVVGGLVVFLWLRMIRWERWRLAPAADASAG